jgi:hypothetical protein
VTVAASSVVDDVLRAYDRWGVGPEVGAEWGKIRREARAVFHAALAQRDTATLEALLTPLLNRVTLPAEIKADEWFGIVSPSSHPDDEPAWRRILGEDANTARLEYPGDPPGNMWPDAPRHDAEAYILIGCACRIIEIGGGYGGLAFHLYQHDPECLRYVGIDLADTLYLAYAFLAPKMPAGTVSLGYDPDAAISLVPSHDIPPLEGYEAVVNYRSFGEMEPAEIARYFRLIETWAPQWVIHENASRIDPGSEPEALARYRRGVAWRGYEDVPVQDFPAIPGYRIQVQDRSPWHMGDRYLRTILEREGV